MALLVVYLWLMIAFVSPTLCNSSSESFSFDPATLCMKEFISSQNQVFHMAMDKLENDSLLFSDGHSLKTARTNIIETIGGLAMTNGYTEGVGESALFGEITGFYQLSNLSVILADNGNHCLRLIDRITKQTEVYLGTCGSFKYGYRDGTDPLFHYPWSIIPDNQSPGMLFVTDQENYAVRHLDTSTKNVSTFIRRDNEDFYVKSVAQDRKTGDLFISTDSLIYRVGYYDDVRIATVLAGSDRLGNANGDFSLIQFAYPSEMVIFNNGSKILVADEYHNVLRILDLESRTSSSFCHFLEIFRNGNMDICSLEQPVSLLVWGDVIYVGEYYGIRQIKADSWCNETTSTSSTLVTHTTKPLQELAENQALSQNNVADFAKPALKLDNTTVKPDRSNSDGSTQGNGMSLMMGFGTVVFSITVLGILIRTRYVMRKREKRHWQKSSDVMKGLDWLAKLKQESSAKVRAVLVSSDKLSYNADDVLGDGHFGCIYRGEISLDTQPASTESVAIKVLKAEAPKSNEMAKFLDEAILLLGYSHENVLRTYAVCLSLPPMGLPAIVLPYMANGDLKSFVRNQETRLVVGDLLVLANHVACGMEYLSHNSFVHRDLAARNCLVSADYTVRISDFGFSRDVYVKGYYQLMDPQKTPLPVKWTALEALKSGTFTSKSDVWSFGVLMWELFSLGGEPYSDVNWWDMITYLEQGNRLRMPISLESQDSIYNVMLACWSKKPEERPLFSELVECLTNFTRGFTSTLHGTSVQNTRL